MTDTATHPETNTTDVAPRIAAWAFVAALAVIVVAAGWVLWRDRGWLASSDLAFFEIELMRMPGEWPLVGVYSRYGWSHPGPLLYYLLWGPWRLFGGASVGLLFGMLLLHLSTLVFAWFAARFRSLAAAVLVVGALLTVWAGVGTSEALLAWNPLVGLLFGGTALVLAWNVSVRGRLGAVLLFPIGSLLVQSHVSTAPVVVVLCLVGTLLAAWPTGQRESMPWRWWFAGAAIAVVVWLPPLIDQFTGSGNLGQILAAAGAGGPGLGLRQGVTVVSDAFAVPPYWWQPTLGFLPDQLALPWLLVPLLLATVVALVKRDPTHLRFLTLASISLLVAALSVSRFLDPSTHLGAWIPGMAMVVVAMSLWILCAAVGRERLILLLSPLLLIAPAAGVAVTLVTDPPPLGRISDLVRSGTDAIRSAHVADSGVHLQTELDAESFEALPALVAELQGQGVPVSASTPGDWPPHLLALINPEPADRTPIRIRKVWDPDEPAPDGWRIIAEGAPFTVDEWRQIQELRRGTNDSALTADERSLNGWALGDLLDGRYAWQILAPED